MKENGQALREAFTVSLVQLARRWRWRLDRRLSDLGLTEARWAVLLQISRSTEPPSQRELAEFVGIEGATLVPLLTGLERQNLIRRLPDPKDGRARRVHLTDKATGLLAEIEATAHGLRLELTAGLDDATLQTCLTVFRHIDGELTRLSESDA